ncbi:hypothetical protein [Streptomyces sp. TP-A0356]|uniref:hypothetical protein n=1 Tax=Streptomyces sp. TP-A0356 TaxID=1359208 RepID=UPI0006E33A7D|nr:hypothetical protein [Streptomyces sp. TP-A0356]
MAVPPQARPNTAQHADRNATIFNLRVAGLTVRQIATQVELSPTRVQEILTEEIGARVGPAAEEYVALREAELSALWKRAYTIMTTAEDPDTRLKAVDRLLRINESRRRLRGADAPEALTVALDKRVDDEANDVAAAVAAAVQAVTAALPDVDGAYRAKLQDYAFEMAGRALRSLGGGDPGPEPEPPRQQLALPPGPSARPPSAAPAPPLGGEPDSADAVLAQLANFEYEFGPLEDDNDD